MDGIATPLGPPAAQRSVLLPCVLLAVLSIASVAWRWNGGNVDTETIAMVPRYTRDRPLLAKIFDPHANDFTQYQARELSYFFDCLDANVYRAVGAPLAPSFFIPATALVIPLFFALVYARAVRSTRLDALTAVLLFGCFLSCFGFVSTLGFLYRSGKPVLALAAFTLLVALRQLDRRRAAGGTAPNRLLTAATGAAFCGAVFVGLLDRQGAFYVLGATGLLVLHHLLTRRLADIAIATGCAGIAVQAYNLWLGPWLIHRLNGYWPYFGFQDIPYGQATRQIGPAFRLFAENIGVLFGGFHSLALGAAAAFLALLLWAVRRPRPAAPSNRVPGRSPFLLYVALGVVAHVVMYALMIARHPYVYFWVDHRYWYYPFPLQAIALFVALIALDHAAAAFAPRQKLGLRLLLVAILIGNVASIDHYQRLMVGGPWFGPVYQQSERLKAHLRSGVDDPLLAPNYREFAAFVREAAGIKHPPDDDALPGSHQVLTSPRPPAREN